MEVAVNNPKPERSHNNQRLGDGEPLVARIGLASQDLAKSADRSSGTAIMPNPTSEKRCARSRCAIRRIVNEVGEFDVEGPVL